MSEANHRDREAVEKKGGSKGGAAPLVDRTQG